VEGTAIDTQAVIVIVNAAVAGALVVGAGAWLARGDLSVTAPTRRQLLGEFVLRFFVGKARDMAHGEERDRVMRIVAPLLASFFLFIFVCNLLVIVPLPEVNRPPTSHFSVTLGLALASVAGTLAVSATVRGAGATVKHLFWPNPMQWVSEITDVLSLSLRLFGNIAGEFMTLLLVMAVVPWGIPLILHTLGLIPAFVQALVFTLLTASFISHAIHREERKREVSRAAVTAEKAAVSDDASLEGGA
jgi:F-type H+-transporting ATPase subunit a